MIRSSSASETARQRAEEANELGSLVEEARAPQEDLSSWESL